MKKANTVLPDGTVLPEGYEFIDGEIYTPDSRWGRRVLTIAEYKNGYMAAPNNTSEILDQVTDQMKPLFEFSEIISNAKNTQEALNKTKAYLNEYEPDVKKNPSQEDENLTLEQLFKDPEKYKQTIEKLTAKGLIRINGDTCTYVDANKATAAAIIKDLHGKGYLRTKPTSKQIRSILLNSFGLSISESHIEKTKPDIYNVQKLQL